MWNLCPPPNPPKTDLQGLKFDTQMEGLGRFTKHFRYQVPKMEVLTYISCTDTAYGYGKTHPQNSLIRYRNPSNVTRQVPRVQETPVYGVQVGRFRRENYLGWCWNLVNNGISTTNLNWWVCWISEQKQQYVMRGVVLGVAKKIENSVGSHNLFQSLWYGEPVLNLNKKLQWTSV